MKSIIHNRLRHFTVVVGMIVFACSESTSVPAPPSTTQKAPVDTFDYDVINVYPHDTGAWTQGLVYVDGVLIEGTGYNLGASTLRRVRLETGEVMQQIELPHPLYGEGVVLWGDSLIQLTWQDRVAIIYDGETFGEIGRFQYQTEGWGLTHDGEKLIMSDGTSTIYFRDPNTFAVNGQIEVTGENGPVTMLNELEYINGFIYANVWQTNFIVIISPQTGDVVGRIDLTGLLGITYRRGLAANFLNGIAYDAARDRLFVTGKLWPRLYQIKLIPRE